MLVSVIVPVYNVSGTLRACVKSIQRQSYSNIEIILVDDGSKDNSGEICDLLAEDDFRIKVVHQENAGIPMARNAGLKVAIGEYVCFVDSDDEITPDYVSKMVNAQQSTNAELVVCGITLYEVRKTTFLSEKDSVFDLEDNIYNTFLKLFSDFIMIPVWNKLFLKSVFVEHDLWFDKTFTACGEDGPFVVNYLKYCKKIAFVKEEMYHYLCYHSSSAQRFWPIECQIKFFEIKKECLEMHCKDVRQVESYCIRKSLHNLRTRMQYLIQKEKWNSSEVIKCCEYYWKYIEPFIEQGELFEEEDYQWLIDNLEILKKKDVNMLYRRCKRLYALPWKKIVLRKIKKYILQI